MTLCIYYLILVTILLKYLTQGILSGKQHLYERVVDFLHGCQFDPGIGHEL